MKVYDLFYPIIEKAKYFPFWLRVLNLVLAFSIPFNRPHGFHIESLKDGMVRTKSRYRRNNFNHIRGIHACAIATIAEFSAGFLLLTWLPPGKYRLIMSHLEIEYNYQAKEDIFSESWFEKDRVEQEVLAPLKTAELATVKMESRVKDTSGNDVAVAHSTWQIKEWGRVQTEV